MHKSLTVSWLQPATIGVGVLAAACAGVAVYVYRCSVIAPTYEERFNAFLFGDGRLDNRLVTMPSPAPRQELANEFLLCYVQRNSDGTAREVFALKGSAVLRVCQVGHGVLGCDKNCIVTDTSLCEEYVLRAEEVQRARMRLDELGFFDWQSVRGSSVDAICEDQVVVYDSSRRHQVVVPYLSHLWPTRGSVFVDLPPPPVTDRDDRLHALLKKVGALAVEMRRLGQGSR